MAESFCQIFEGERWVGSGGVGEEGGGVGWRLKRPIPVADRPKYHLFAGQIRTNTSFKRYRVDSIVINAVKAVICIVDSNAVKAVICIVSSNAVKAVICTLQDKAFRLNSH